MERFNEWAFKYRTVIVCILAFLLMNAFFPAPYSWTYWLKRAIWTPTFVCRDGVYSWSKGGSGTCSNHGGVARRYQ